MSLHLCTILFILDVFRGLVDLIHLVFTPRMVKGRVGGPCMKKKWSLEVFSKLTFTHFCLSFDRDISRRFYISRGKSEKRTSEWKFYELSPKWSWKPVWLSSAIVSMLISAAKKLLSPNSISIWLKKWDNKWNKIYLGHLAKQLDRNKGWEKQGLLLPKHRFQNVRLFSRTIGIQSSNELQNWTALVRNAQQLREFCIPARDSASQGVLLNTNDDSWTSFTDRRGYNFLGMEQRRLSEMISSETFRRKHYIRTMNLPLYADNRRTIKNHRWHVFLLHGVLKRRKIQAHISPKGVHCC